MVPIFFPYAPVNFGIGGDRTEHVLWRIDDSALKTPHSPQVCVIMVGTNNTGQYKGRQTPQETAEGTREIASRVHRLHPAKLFFCTSFPGENGGRPPAHPK